MVGTVPKSGIQDKNNVQTQLNYGPAGFFSGFDHINSDYHVDTDILFDEEIVASVSPSLAIDASIVTYGLNDGIADIDAYASADLGLNQPSFSTIFTESSFDASSEYNLCPAPQYATSS